MAIGVFICECGGQVSRVLDVEALAESARGWPGVVYAAQAPYWCSTDGRERLQASVRAAALERVIVAGCSPRTHRRLFQETVAQAGLNPDLLRVVNVREGCAWPHRGEPLAAAARARDQIAMEVARITSLILREPLQAEVIPAALVIGGGVAGMTAALELADAGIPVTLVERAPALGGMAVNDAPELAAELITALQAQPGITAHLDSPITQVDGSVGAYHVEITQGTPAACNTPPSRRKRYGPFGAIIFATGAPDEETSRLARLLRLTQDAEGFIPELRVRLRPRDYIERGIYVCGSAHYPCDAAEAQFQAYSAASRALRHLRKGSVTAHGAVAQVVPEKCNGCGDCFKVCPFAAVTMVERSEPHPDGSTGSPRWLVKGTCPPWPCRATAGEPGEGPIEGPVAGLSLAVIDPLLCTGCGNCVSVCPVGAVTVDGGTDAQLEAQVRVALGGTWPQRATHSDTGGTTPALPRILIFACEWSGYAAAELAGAQKLTYPPNVRVIRLDCSGRLQPGLILKAFEMGAAGVLVLGCAPKLCHYERGNERAAAAYEQVEALTGLLGLSPTRLQLAWIAPDDGPAFAESVTGFVEVQAGSGE